MPDKIEAFIILLFLLPGFIGLIVYEIVAEVPKRDTFDKVVIAIALTVVATVVHGYFGNLGKPPAIEQLAAITAVKADQQSAQQVASVKAIIEGLGVTTAIAAVLGLVFAGTGRPRIIVSVGEGERPVTAKPGSGGKKPARVSRVRVRASDAL